VTNREHKPVYQLPKLTGKSPEKPKKELLQSDWRKKVS